MRAVIQRVRQASVIADERATGDIGKGLVVLLGVRRGDGDREVEYMAEKILDLRIFPDERHPINKSLRDEGGEILLVSQFTLYGDCRRGRRPSFDEAELPERAEEVYRQFADALTQRGFSPQEGVFGASMAVSLVNDGPVTILVDSAKGF